MTQDRSICSIGFRLWSSMLGIGVLSCAPDSSDSNNLVTWQDCFENDEDRNSLSNPSRSVPAKIEEANGTKSAPQTRYCRPPNSAFDSPPSPFPSSSSLILKKIVPSVVSTDGGMIVIIGGTFQPGDQLWIGGVKVEKMHLLSATEIQAILPPRPDQFGAAWVEIRRTHNASIGRSDLLRFAVNDFRFGRNAIASGYSPTSVVAADFNNDLKLDLTASNLLDTETWVVFGDGIGQFNDLTSTWPTDPDEETRSYSAVVGDWDGDGNKDLALAQGAGQEVRILWGDGTGIFPQISHLKTSTMPVSVISADVDGDGINDIVAAGRAPDQFVMFHNNGNRNFATSVTWSAGINPSAVIATDLNSDLQTDLLVSNEGSGDITILLSETTGSMAVTVQIPTCADPRTVTAADVNEDGRLDILTACPKSGFVCRHLSDGFGGLGKPDCMVAGQEPVALAVSDLDGDGHADIAVANYKGGTASILRGRGDGTFLPAEQFLTGKNSTGIVAADFNQDGRPDLAVSNLSSGYTTVHINQARRPAP